MKNFSNNYVFSKQINENRNYFKQMRRFKDISIGLFTEHDISEQYLSWLNDSKHMQYSDQQFTSHSYDSAKVYLESFINSPNLFLKIQNEAGALMGTLTVYIDTFHKVHNCGILVDPNSVGLGFGKKAWVSLTHNICPLLGARKIVGGTVAENYAMIKLFEWSDMNFEARLHAEKQYNGRDYDVLIYSKFVS